MRIKSGKHLQQLVEDQKLGDSARRQLEAHLDEQSQRGGHTETGNGKTSPRTASVETARTDSPGERCVWLALKERFGQWRDGGEVVSELMPFRQRRIRVDFALPRYLIYVEVDGWSHHGRFLEDHHRDNARSLVLSGANWLGFRVTHAQATQEPGSVVDAIEQAMAFRVPIAREELRVEPTRGSSGRHKRLVIDYEALKYRDTAYPR